MSCEKNQELNLTYQKLVNLDLSEGKVIHN
jgi:hypothetical protein